MESSRMRRNGSGSPERSPKGRPEPTGSKQLKHHQRQQHHERHQQERLQPGTKIPVVYYLCKNRHLEHPHFIEVPVSSAEGLYLKDVINRLNVLRGKGMAAMYSWSCKRSYKNGFVWHDLSDDDLILPANGNEYILKGSELLDTTPPDRCILPTTTNHKLQSSRHQPQQLESSSLASRSQDSSPSTPGGISDREHQRPTLPPSPKTPPPLALPPPQEEQLSPPMRRPSSSSGDASPETPPRNFSRCSDGGSPNLLEYRDCKPSTGATDAATQTEERSGSVGDRRMLLTHGPQTTTCARGVSTDDDGQLDPNPTDEGRHSHRFNKDSSDTCRVDDDISPPPTSSSTSSSGGGKVDTLESLIRAEATKINSFKMLEGGEDVYVPIGPTKLKATNMLVQLITCGSISVKDNSGFGLVHTYKPRFSHAKFQPLTFGSSMVLGELDYVADNPRFVGLRLEDKQYFSGSIIETNMREKDEEVVPSLKRSSSYNADRSFKRADLVAEKAQLLDSSARSKCLPRSIRITSSKQPKTEIAKSPVSDGPRISSGDRDFGRLSSICKSKGNSKRFEDSSSAMGSSKRLDSAEEREKIIKIDERLASGARVVIQSRAPCDDSDSNLTP